MSETANEKRMRKEKELENTNQFGLSMKKDSKLRKLKNAITGDDDFGTSLSAGAVDAGNRKVAEIWDRGGITLGDAALGAEARQAAREAAAEERREANRADMMKTVNKKKGGMIKASASKRADGCAQRGKTRGKMV